MTGIVIEREKEGRLSFLCMQPDQSGGMEIYGDDF